jgi:uncharacterized protein DUF3106
MVRRSVQAGVLALGLLVACGAEARPRPQQRVVPAPRRRAVMPPGPLNRPNAPLVGRAADLPPNWIEQLQEMRPAEQERFLKNNDRFRGLPAQQQQLIRRRLRVWNNLSADQRQELLERQQIWEQLGPDQRRQVRESLLPKWQNMPLPRRAAIMAKLRELRSLDASQRNAKLSDESFLSTLNPDERQMLRDLSNLGVGQAAG